MRRALVSGPGHKKGEAGQVVQDEARTSEEERAQGAGDSQTPRTGQVSGHWGSRGPSVPGLPQLESPLSRYLGPGCLIGSGERPRACRALRNPRTDRLPGRTSHTRETPHNRHSASLRTENSSRTQTLHLLPALESSTRDSRPFPTQHPWATGVGVSVGMWARLL